MTLTERTAVGPGHVASTLLERDSELAVVEAAAADVLSGKGSLIIVEGEAGIGKSSILRHAVAVSKASDLIVLTARASELERNYPFGIVLDLFRPLLRDGVARDVLFRDAASLATPIFEGSLDLEVNGSADPFPTLHGLFWLTVNATEQGPLAIIIDDAHWADDASLRFIHYVAQRLEELPVLILIGQRPRQGVSEDDPGGLLASHSDAIHLRPSRLTQGAIAKMVQANGIDDPDKSLGRSFWEMTAGNPFFATELLRVTRDSNTEGVDLVPGEAVPETVSRSILSRLKRIGDASHRIAEALAVLGDGATMGDVVSLAGIDDEAAAAAVRRLVDAAILDPGKSVAFIHPIAQSAIYGAMSAPIRAQAHRAAAVLLRGRGAPSEAVVVHLLATEPAGDAEVVAILRRAAQGAIARAAPTVAQTYLRRALAEPPKEGERPGVLLDLARADAAIGTERTVDRYREALEGITDPIQRAEVMLELGHSLINAVDWEGAADAFQQGLAQLGGRHPHLAGRLEAGFVSAAFVSLTRRGEAEKLLQRVVSEDPIDEGHRELAAWAAFQRTGAVTSTAREMGALARRALSGAPPEDLVRAGQLIEVAAGVLLATDQLEDEVQVLTTAIETVQRLGLQAKFGTYSYCRAWPLYYMGRLSESIADAQAAIGAHELGWETFFPATCSVLGWAHIERGEVEEAARVIDLDDARWSQRLDYQLLVPITRGRVAFERGSFEEAARQFDLARQGGEITGLNTPVPPDWRTWMTITLSRLGRRDEARRLAAEALELAERWGASWPIGIALRAAGVAEGGADGIELLRRAVDQLAAGPARLEHARALIVLGEALRRSGKTVDARESLIQGADLAHGMGAGNLEARARRELLASGARPRRYAVTGVDALTPSELRVAQMAALGRTNREVAQSLFVTPKAIEYHLANAYRKLGIRSRTELSRALEPAAELASV